MFNKLEMKINTLSELIDELEKIKNDHGDINVRSAYDGAWGLPTELVLFEGYLVIGVLS